MKIFSVHEVTVVRRNASPLELVITAVGMASSTGWTNPRLDAASDPNPADAVLEFAFEADRPGGITLPVLTPITASTVVTPAHGADAVIVHARTNSITVHASEFIDVPSSGPTPLPYPRPPFTTFAVGEEVFPTSTPSGEESMPTTFRVGEEGVPTLRFGENGPWTDPRVDDPAVAVPTGIFEGQTSPWPGNDPWGPIRRGNPFGGF
jgi:hypothetical protein